MKATVKLFMNFYDVDLAHRCLGFNVTLSFSHPFETKTSTSWTYRNENSRVQFVNCIQMWFGIKINTEFSMASEIGENPIDTICRLKSWRQMAIKNLFKSLITMYMSSPSPSFINRNHRNYYTKEMNNLVKSDLKSSAFFGVEKPSVSCQFSVLTFIFPLHFVVFTTNLIAENATWFWYGIKIQRFIHS